MTEHSLWSAVRRNLKPYVQRLVRVENKADPGTPDVYYRISATRSGWIELKHLDEAPVKPTTTLRIPHLTMEQVTWMHQETAAGGRCFLMLQVAREYFLLRPSAATAIFHHHLTMGYIRNNALVIAQGKFPTKEVLSCL